MSAEYAAVKAYIQRVKLDGLIRAGEGCEKYGDPYEQISAFKELPGGVIEIVGLCTTCPHCGKGSLRPQHVKATHRAFSDLGFTVEWDRANHKPRRIKMTKDNPHGKHPTMADIPKAKTAKHDQNAIIKIAKHFLKLHEDGKLEVIPISEIDSPENPGFTRVTFDRKIADGA